MDRRACCLIPPTECLLSHPPPPPIIPPLLPLVSTVRVQITSCAVGRATVQQHHNFLSLVGGRRSRHFLLLLCPPAVVSATFSLGHRFKNARPSINANLPDKPLVCVSCPSCAGVDDNELLTRRPKLIYEQLYREWSRDSTGG